MGDNLQAWIVPSVVMAVLLRFGERDAIEMRENRA
jgi:hypothetical protein